jgi:hypothetical protein
MSAASTPLSVSSAATDHTIFHDFEDPLHEYNSHPSEHSMAHASQTDSLLICRACGTQFDAENRKVLTRCRICDDQRQFVPPSGQAFTTLRELKDSPKAYKNKWKAFDDDDRFWSIWTEPKVAIGQRAILIKTPQGNILWDCITFLDNETIAKINSLGGLAAIVISHPHYYTTHLEWADAFSCPVYLSWEDKAWLNRLDRLGKARTFIESVEEEVEIAGEKSGVVALKLGGHFPGSLVCLAHGRLLIADTLMTTPSGLGDWSKGPDGKKDGKLDGMNSYVFMWSIPNMIPLSPEVIEGMWKVLKRYDFRSTHGAFVGTEIHDGGGGSESKVKERVLESMQIQVKSMGWSSHAFLKEVI